MFISDAKMTQLHYEDRLQQAAYDRFAEQLERRSASNQYGFLEKLGELLIVTGTNLKKLTSASGTRSQSGVTRVKVRVWRNPSH